MSYGYITSAEDVKNALKELNRNYEGRKVWSDLYSSVNLAEQQALSSLKSDYSSDITQAYVNAHKNKAAIANSDLLSGYKQSAMSDLDHSLNEAFESYRQNYLSQRSNIISTMEDARASIDTALTEQAENTVAYQNSMYNYLEDLWNRSQGLGDYKGNEDVLLADIFKNDPLWNRYTKQNYEYALDENGNIVRDADGNPTYVTDEQGKPVVASTSLLSSSELYSQLYDGNGLITEKGKDFYDQMLNQLGVIEGSDYSFHKYLSESNPELYDWSISKNAYDYTEAGTNLGTFKTLMGLESTDNEYKYIERYGGLSEAEVKKQVSDIGNYVGELQAKAKAGDVRGMLDNFKSVSTNLKSYINTLQLDDATKKEMLAKIDEFESVVNASYSGVKSTNNWTTLAETAQAVRDDWGRVQSEWNSRSIGGGKLLASGMQLGVMVVDAPATFLMGMLEDTADTVSNWGASMLDSLTGTNVSKLRYGLHLPGNEPANRHNAAQKSNEKLARDVEQKYLDLLAYLASASSKNQSK